MPASEISERGRQAPGPSGSGPVPAPASSSSVPKKASAPEDASVPKKASVSGGAASAEGSSDPSGTVTLADLTTLRVGGPVASYVPATTRDRLIGAVLDADDAGRPLLVLGGGSNLVGSDLGFDGVVVRDLRRGVRVLTETAADPRRTVRVRAEAGVRWDAFVRLMVSRGYEGVEALSGIPGTVGASVVQNIGAYGQEVSASVDSVEAWDRQESRIVTLSPSQMSFGYRTSALKLGMYAEPGVPDRRWFPTPRFVVLSVTFALVDDPTVSVDFGQLAHALGVETGTRMDISRVRSTVLSVRAAKGMLEDPGRYRNRLLEPLSRDPEVSGVPAGTRKHVGPVVRRASAASTELSQELTHDRWSCGSFFVNPVVSQEVADRLPADAPRFPVTVADGPDREERSAVKTSAAWLIDHAGFPKGFSLRPHAPAALSTLHTLALTNRGGASAAQIMELARAVQKGVRTVFGIDLVPEPVILQGLEPGRGADSPASGRSDAADPSDTPDSGEDA